MLCKINIKILITIMEFNTLYQDFVNIIMATIIKCH